MILDYGDRALLVECNSTAEVLAFVAALDPRPTGVADVVPGARTVLVTLTEPAHQAATRTALAGIEVSAPGADPAPADHIDVIIDVIYDGVDLTAVADLLDMTREEVVAAHTGTPWRVGFCGFAPGFGYLVGGDPRLRVPRRAEPRTRVPAGSVGLAGEFSGVYPRASPGGWQLIGRTEAVLWDISREQPALLTPGMWVSFRAREIR